MAGLPVGFRNTVPSGWAINVNLPFKTTIIPVCLANERAAPPLASTSFTDSEVAGHFSRMRRDNRRRLSVPEISEQIRISRQNIQCIRIQHQRSLHRKKGRPATICLPPQTFQARTNGHCRNLTGFFLEPVSTVGMKGAFSWRRQINGCVTLAASACLSDSGTARVT